MAVVKPCASILASVQPSRHEASSWSARRRSGFGLRRGARRVEGVGILRGSAVGRLSDSPAASVRVAAPSLALQICKMLLEVLLR